MNRNPFELTKQTKPYLEAFLREVSTGKPNKYRVVPIRYIKYLFDQWCDLRGGFESLKMSTQRISYLLSLLGYTGSRRTRSTITCFNVELLSEPAPPTSDVSEILGARCLDTFTFPPLADTPAAITNEIIAVRHTVELLEKRRQEEAERFTDEERVLPPHVLINSPKAPTSSAVPLNGYDPAEEPPTSTEEPQSTEELPDAEYDS